MNLKVTSKEVQLTDGMKEALVSKLEFLNKFVKEDSPVQVKVSVDKGVHKISILFPYHNELVKLDVETADYYASVDLLVDKLKNQMSKLHDIKIDRKRKDNFSTMLLSEQQEEEEVSHEGQIVKRKSFAMKPMSEEEAILQMELLGHQTFMFANADLDFAMCMIYKRKDNNYGIIESTH